MVLSPLIRQLVPSCHLLAQCLLLLLPECPLPPLVVFPLPRLLGCLPLLLLVCLLQANPSPLLALPGAILDPLLALLVVILGLQVDLAPLQEALVVPLGEVAASEVVEEEGECHYSN